MACSWLLAACGDADDPDGGAGGAGAGSGGGAAQSGSGGGAAQSGDATVNLTLTGSIEATLSGRAGTCGGVEGGFSVQLYSADLGVSPSFELATIILGEEDWAAPPTVLNEKEGDRRSFAWNKSAGSVVAERNRSRVDYTDVVLKAVVASDSVTVNGSIVCDE